MQESLPPFYGPSTPPLGPAKSGTTAIICANGCELTRIWRRSADPPTVTQVALVKSTGFQNNAETHRCVEGLLEGEGMDRGVRKRGEGWGEARAIRMLCIHV